MDGLTDHAKRNRAFWNELSDTYQADHGPDLARHGAGWGVWQIPEDEIHALGNVSGKDVLELGCGAAQWSIALAQHGARPVGLDNHGRHELQMPPRRHLGHDAAVLCM